MQAATPLAKERLQLELLGFLAYSPDVAPIENVWGHIDDKVDKEKITTKAELQEEIEKVWRSLKKEYAKNLVD